MKANCHGLIETPSGRVPRGGGAEGNHLKHFVRIANVPTEIRTGFVQNRNP